MRTLTFPLLLTLPLFAACNPRGSDAKEDLTESDTDTDTDTDSDTDTDTDSDTDTDAGPCDRGAETVDLIGTLSQDYQLCPQDTVTLYGEVILEAGHTIALAPGTVVKGAPEGGGYVASSLKISVGATIDAEGTAAAPVVFTSLRASPAAGDWGGLILEGNAPGMGNASGDPQDSSGTIRYTRIEYAGATVGETELNGIALTNVGAGTTLEYLNVYEAGDDSIEFFGGTVNASYLVLINTGDDSLDWTNGFAGTVQYVYIAGGTNERGIEADNRDPAVAPVDELPQSSPNIYNVTLVGAEKAGAHLRRGTAGRIVNSILTGAAECGIYVDADAARLGAENLAFRNNLIFGNAGGAFCAPASESDGDASAFAVNTLEEDPQLDGHLPSAGSPALDPANADTSVSPFLGAFGPEDWAAGWTVGLE